MTSRVVVLGVGADGEQVGCHAGPWQDPFDVPLSEANADFVRRSGKWVAFDLTEVPPYAQLVGRITSVQPMKRGEKVFGVTLINDVGAKVEVTCDADETWVRFSPG